MDDDIPYLLLTPGPLTTSRSVRQAMQSDFSTWDADYNQRVEFVRSELVRLAVDDEELHTSVLMQGSGTFAVESTVGSVIPPEGPWPVCRAGRGWRGCRIPPDTTSAKCPEPRAGWGWWRYDRDRSWTR